MSNQQKQQDLSLDSLLRCTSCGSEVTEASPSNIKL